MTSMATVYYAVRYYAYTTELQLYFVESLYTDIQGALTVYIPSVSSIQTIGLSCAPCPAHSTEAEEAPAGYTAPAQPAAALPSAPPWARQSGSEQTVCFWNDWTYGHTYSHMDNTGSRNMHVVHKY